MRPSQYHYIKRIWTRNSPKRKRIGCIGFLFRCFVLFIVFLLLASLGMLAIPIILTVCLMILAIDKMIYLANPLKYCKKHFDVLDEKQRNEYKKLLFSKLEETKELANIINTTTNANEFLYSFRELISQLEELSIHEYTGWFTVESPTTVLRRTLRNKALTEIDFIKRAYFQDGTPLVIPSENYQFLSSFSREANEFIKTQDESIVTEIKTRIKPPKYVNRKMSDYDLELFAKQCNSYLEYEDKKERWNSENN